MSSPGFANSNQLISFKVGHGCSGADTYRIQVHLPTEVTSVRAMPSAFGDAQVVQNDQAIPTSVIWEKADVKDADDQYYEFQIRIKVPDAPFTTLYFPTTQVCRDSEGTETTVEWSAIMPTAEDEPAPTLRVLPPRAAGWNKYVVPSEISDLEAFFADAQIVWSGDAAYSANPTTMELIEAEAGVTVLATVAAGAEIWVKY